MPVIFGVQAEGDVFLTNQAILPAQCFFRHDLVHLLGIAVTVIPTQRQEGVAAELLLVHAAGDKVDLQMQRRVKVVQKLTIFRKNVLLLFQHGNLEVHIGESHRHREKPRLHLADAILRHTQVLQAVTGFLWHFACGNALFCMLFGFLYLLCVLPPFFGGFPFFSF